jgi:nucleoside phosphorylase
MGSIASSDRVLRGPREKAAFAAGCAALAVDMESGALREWASGRGASFLAARAVLDEAADSLPSGVPEGHGFWDLARYALAHFREVPAMARAASRMGPALENLRAFLRVWLGEVKSDE